MNESKNFEWSTECKNSITELKKLLDAPVLGYPNDRDPCTFTTDASLTGIGAILTQKQGTDDRIIAYASKTLSKKQRNYSATKRELFEIVHFTQHFKNYLQSKLYKNSMPNKQGDISILVFRNSTIISDVGFRKWT